MNNLSIDNNITHILPQEIQSYLFSFLDDKSLARTAQVCRQWNRLIQANPINDKLLWQTLFEQCYKYVPTDNSKSFRELYVQRQRLFNTIKTGNYKERFVPTPGARNQTYPLTTTHMLFINGTMNSPCFDRATYRKSPLLPLTQNNHISQIAKDILLVGSSDTVDIQIYDVSVKNLAHCLFVGQCVPNHSFSTSNGKTICYFSTQTEPLCILDLETKKEQQFESIVLKELIRVDVDNARLLFVKTTELIIVDLTTYKETHCPLPQNIDFSLPSHGLQSVSKATALKGNNYFLFIQNTQQIIIFDLKTTTHRTITTQVPFFFLDSHRTEDFFIQYDRTNNKMYIWEFAYFTDNPLVLKDTGDVQLIDKERMLTISVSSPSFVKIWNLHDGTLEHELPLLGSPLSASHELCFEHIAHISLTYEYTNYSRTRVTSIFIDMRNGKIIGQKEIANCFSLTSYSSEASFDSQSYNLAGTDGKVRGIKVFDFTRPATKEEAKNETESLDFTPPKTAAEGSLGTVIHSVKASAQKIARCFRLRS